LTRTVIFQIKHQPRKETNMSKKFDEVRKPDMTEEQERGFQTDRERRMSSPKDDKWEKEAMLDAIENAEDDELKLGCLHNYESRYGGLTDDKRRDLGVRGKLLERYKEGNWQSGARG